MATTTKAPETSQSRQAPFLVELYKTSMGKKYAMAISGIMMLGYVFAHMVGNLKLYLPDHDGIPAIDHYGEFLRESLLVPILPETGMLWILRLALLGALAVHLHAAWSLTVANRRARPESYRSPRNYQLATFASRSMRWTGVIVLLYIVFHLADITWGTEGIAAGNWEQGSVKANLIGSLSRPGVAFFYLLANTALGIHLYHGVWSLFQTLGVGSAKGKDWRRMAATGFTSIVVIGNLSFPIAILTGAVS
ncbi:MAG: succinate dehydrogenase / fumarate reductase cytochrome b subunit [Myxococcota bacterium]|jgi:succinate dehydrogenase / fumarate reductase cytochrome b subunit